MRNRTSTKPARPRPMYTSSRTRSLPGVVQAATAQNAAWEGSAGTSIGPAWSGPGRRTTRWPPSWSCTSRSAPAATSISSVWARVGTGSSTVVAPSAPKAASSTADLTWALGTGNEYSVPRRAPPLTEIGGRLPWRRPSTRAPMRRKGTATRSMGRRAIDESPARTVRPSMVATKPASKRMPVPELPTSMTTSGSCRRSCPPSMYSAPGPLSAPAPRATTASRV